MAGDEELRIPIGIPVNTNADQAAGSVGALRDQVARSKDAIGLMSAQLRSLHGKTAEVTAAKDQLRASLAAEKTAISNATLKLLAQGTSYEKLTSHAKAAAEKQKAFNDKLKEKALADAKDKVKNLNAAVTAAGGPVSAMRDKWEAFKDLLQAGGAGGGVGFAALAVAGLGAAVAALVVGVGAAYASLGRFILSGANAARSAGLLREAVTGSAEDAGRLGSQVDALAMKVPTAKDELNKLAVSLRKSGLSGQTLVDTFNAVGQASAALGDDAGNKLRDILDRGKLSGRVAINPMELIGSGMKFDDIAQSLADSMHVGVDAARQALMQGRVKLGDAAKALADYTEKKFGGINLRAMMGDPIATVKKMLDGLTSGIKLDSLEKPFQDFVNLLGPATVTGKEFKNLISFIGHGMVDAIGKALPLAGTFVQSMVQGGLKMEIGWLRLEIALIRAFGPNALQKLNLFGIATKVVAQAGGGLVIFGEIATKMAGFVTALGDVVALGKKITDTDWASVGLSVVDGIVQGLMMGPARLEKAVEGLAGRMKASFTDALGIHSPSAVFAEYGENTTEGFAQGVEAGGGRASGAVGDMVAPPARAGAAGGATAGAAVTVNLTINVQGGGADAAKALSEPGFIAQFVKAVEDSLTGAGIPVQA